MSNESNGSTQQYEFTCVVIGAACSGKTSLVNRLVHNLDGSPDYSMTSRIALSSKSYLHPRRSTTSFEVVYLDTPGKPLYEKLILQVINNLAPKVMIIGVYDVTNRASLLLLENLLGKIHKQQKSPLEYDGILLANKIDLVDKRIISVNEGQQKARMFKYRHFECSASDNLSIDEFHQLLIDSLDSKVFADANLEKRNITII